MFPDVAHITITQIYGHSLHSNMHRQRRRQDSSNFPLMKMYPEILALVCGYKFNLWFY